MPLEVVRQVREELLRLPGQGGGDHRAAGGYVDVARTGDGDARSGLCWGSPCVDRVVLHRLLSRVGDRHDAGGSGMRGTVPVPFSSFICLRRSADVCGTWPWLHVIGVAGGDLSIWRDVPEDGPDPVRVRRVSGSRSSSWALFQFILDSAMSYTGCSGRSYRQLRRRTLGSRQTMRRDGTSAVRLRPIPRPQADTVAACRFRPVAGRVGRRHNCVQIGSCGDGYPDRDGHLHSHLGRASVDRTHAGPGNRRAKPLRDMQGRDYPVFGSSTTNSSPPNRPARSYWRS